MAFTNIQITNYGINSITLQGDTRKYKEDLKKMGGKYDGQLPGGPGWIFPKNKETDCRSFISNGKRLVTIEEEKEADIAGRQRAKDWRERNNPVSRLLPKDDAINQLLDIVSIMSVKIEWMEKAISELLSEHQKKSIDSNKVEKTEYKVIKPRKDIKKSESKSLPNNDLEEDIKPTKRLLGRNK